MSDLDIDPTRLLVPDILLNFRFGVLFLIGGLIPNPIDIRFQKVRGLSTQVKTMTVEEGGQNLYKQTLPTTIDHDNLILERGVVVGSPMNIEWNVTMSLFKFNPGNCLITLFNDTGIPVAAWLFLRVYPVKWSTSDLNAEEKGVLIDTFEMSYSSMQILRI